MRLWPISALSPRSVAPQPSDADIAALVDCVGRPDFGAAALDRLNAQFAAASWAAYRVYDDRPPALCMSGSAGIPDSTHACFAAYRDGLYRQDSSFEGAGRRVLSEGPVLAHWRAEEIQPTQREQIYHRYGMLERLSLVCRDESDEGILAVNLYRHTHQPRFSDAEIAFVLGMGQSMLACVRRHVALMPADRPDPVDTLRRNCPALTTRELEVCSRLLKGMTLDGIAADLSLSAATVKTYRNRAFERLGIHFRNQLFDLAMGVRLPTGH